MQQILQELHLLHLLPALQAENVDLSLLGSISITQGDTPRLSLKPSL
jgi:hypothetical protein